MRRLFLAAFAASCFATCARAQSSAPGPIATPSGTLQFVHAERAFAAMLENDTFDRFAAGTLAHFDDVDNADRAVRRMLVQTDAGPVMYDFRRRPPIVQRSGRRMGLKRVFWQGEDVVLQSSEGWFRFKGGVLSRLQSSKMTFH